MINPYLSMLHFLRWRKKGPYNSTFNFLGRRNL